MNAVTRNYVPVKKNRKSALAQLIAIHMERGARTISELIELTGYSRAAIFSAKAELEGPAECTPESSRQDGPAGKTVQPSGLTVQPARLDSPAEWTPQSSGLDSAPADASRAPTRARIDINNINNNINNIYTNTSTGVVASTTRTREAASADQPLAPAPSSVPENKSQPKQPVKAVFNRDQLVYQLRIFVEDKPLAEKTIDMLLERYSLDCLSGAMIRLRLKDDEEEIKSYTRMLNLLAEDVARDHARGVRRDVLPWGAKVLPNGAVLSQW